MENPTLYGIKVTYTGEYQPDKNVDTTGDGRPDSSETWIDEYGIVVVVVVVGLLVLGAIAVVYVGGGGVFGSLTHSTASFFGFIGGALKLIDYLSNIEETVEPLEYPMPEGNSLFLQSNSNYISLTMKLRY